MNLVVVTKMNGKPKYVLFCNELMSCISLYVVNEHDNYVHVLNRCAIGVLYN